MKLAELSIRRHVLAYMLSAVLVLFGLIAENLCRTPASRAQPRPVDGFAARPRHRAF